MKASPVPQHSSFCNAFPASPQILVTSRPASSCLRMYWPHHLGNSLHLSRVGSLFPGVYVFFPFGGAHPSTNSPLQTEHRVYLSVGLMVLQAGPSSFRDPSQLLSYSWASHQVPGPPELAVKHPWPWVLIDVLVTFPFNIHSVTINWEPTMSQALF